MDSDFVFFNDNNLKKNYKCQDLPPINGVWVHRYLYHRRSNVYTHLQFILIMESLVGVTFVFATIVVAYNWVGSCGS